MANTVQHRRGSTVSINSYSGAAGEFVYNTTTKRIHAMDGSTLGGAAHALVSDLNSKANSSVTISAGTGLTGGGSLAANRTIALSSTSIAALAKADTSVQTVNGNSPDGSGNVVLDVEFTQEQDSRASAILATFAPAVSWVRTAGYASAGDGGGALYIRSAIEPWHAGKFQSADGAWWEMVSLSHVRPEQFGAFGFDPRTPLGDMTNEAPQLQAALNFLGLTGGGFEFPGGRRFRIDSTLYARITRQQADPKPSAMDIGISDKSSFKIYSDGTGQIVAGAAMTDMLVLQYNSNAVNGVANVRGPDQSTISGLMIDGNGLAQNGIRNDYTRESKITGNIIFDYLSAGLVWTGSGVAEIYGNNFKGPVGIGCFAGQGGDAHIGYNNYAFPLAGGSAVYLEDGGNVTITGGTVNGEGIDNVYGVRIVVTSGNSCRHVNVQNMEWSGCKAGVYARGTTPADRLYGLIVKGNHQSSSAGFDRPMINPGTLVDLQNTDEFIIDGNLGNGRALSAASGAAILTRNCRDGVIVNNEVVNYNGSAWYAQACTNVHWDGGIIRDVGKAGASGLIVDFENCQDCSFNPKSVTQTSGSYAQNGIVERTGSNRNTSDRVVWSGVSAPSTRVGSLSRFRRYPKPFLEASVSTNSSSATLRSGYNVTSVTRNSQGRCQVNFVEAHASGDNYIAVATGLGCVAQIESPSSGSLVVHMTNASGAAVDGAFYLVVESLT